MLQERIYSDYRLVIVVWMKGLLTSALAYRMIELKVYEWFVRISKKEEKY
jgi:hypothetical protein